MDFAGALRKPARIAAGLRRPRGASGMRQLTNALGAAVRARPRPPADAQELCRVLCEEMSVRRGGRPVELRFERFPDELEVTGLWVELQEFDLVIVEERAESTQQLVILGHELWHLHAGHNHHHLAGAALAGRPDWTALENAALSVAARDGSRAADEAAADDFGHRLAAAFRPLLSGRDTGAPLDPLRRSLGYRGRWGTGP